MAYGTGRGRRSGETYPEARASNIAGKTKIDIAKFPAGFPGVSITLSVPGARSGDSCAIIFGSDVKPISILILPHINVFDDKIRFNIADVGEEGWPGGSITFSWAVFRT